MPNCPSCSFPVDAGTKFCIYCDAPIEPAKPITQKVLSAPMLVTTPGLCPNCGSSVDEDSKFCASCRTPLTLITTINCPRCGKSINAATKFCKYCAADLTQSNSQATQSTGAMNDLRNVMNVPNEVLSGMGLQNNGLLMFAVVLLIGSIITIIASYAYINEHPLVRAASSFGYRDSSYELASFGLVAGGIGLLLGIGLLVGGIIIGKRK
jgi:hypothetical protein